MKRLNTVLTLVAFLVIVIICCPSCNVPGTGARTDPQTGTTTVGAQDFIGRTLAGATYLIKSEGTVYNIDTDGSPASEAAATAIASSLVAYDKQLADLSETMKLATDDFKPLVLEAIKWVTAEKTEFMKESKGAFGVAITISQAANAGCSTVDTAGATGETGIPPTTEPKGEPTTKKPTEEPPE